MALDRKSFISAVTVAKYANMQQMQHKLIRSCLVNNRAQDKFRFLEDHEAPNKKVPGYFSFLSNFGFQQCTLLKALMHNSQRLVVLVED